VILTSQKMAKLDIAGAQGCAPAILFAELFEFQLGSLASLIQ
jgi:hypothetical protein